MKAKRGFIETDAKPTYNLNPLWLPDAKKLRLIWVVGYPQHKNIVD
jgi:hypothetical protein